MRPDIVGTVTDLSVFPDGSVDGVWSSHNIEHLHDHEVPLALAEFRRVLKPTGVALVTTPDIEEVAKLVVDGKLDQVAYVSPAGPITALDMIFGHRASIQGGNGFMAVSATYAALRLAQGAGRLVRRSSDRGVVAFLDPRMITARYAGFLQKSVPPFWPTTDRALVLGALERLDATADEVVAVAEPGRRAIGGAPDLQREHPAPAATEMPPDGHTWTDDADEELRDGVDLGLDLDELSESLELPAAVIEARLVELGLTLATS